MGETTGGVGKSGVVEHKSGSISETLFLKLLLTTGNYSRALYCCCTAAVEQYDWIIAVALQLRRNCAVYYALYVPIN